MVGEKINEIRIVFLLLLAFFSFEGFGQVHRAHYVAEVHTSQSSQWSGNAVLLFSDTAAAFVYPDWATEGDFYFENGVCHSTFGDTEGMKHYLNRNTGQLIHKSFYSTPGAWNFIFTDPIPDINWKIGVDTMTVKGLLATKATGHYGGRDYKAWFTPEIPSSFGPLYFGGLPGLIVQLNSLDGIVNYYLDGLDYNFDDTDGILSPPKDGKHTDMEMFKKYMISKLHRTEALSHDDTKTTLTTASPDYDVVKNRWTVIKDYKKKRGY